MSYVDLATIHVPATAGVAPASWGLQIRENEEFFIDPPACSVYNTTVQSIANNTLVALTANSENFDNDGMHSTVSNTSRLTCQTPGRYFFMAQVFFDANNTGARLVDMAVNGATLSGSGVQVPPAPSTTTNLYYGRNVVLSAGDYVETRVRQTSGGALDATLVEFSAKFITR